MRKYLKGALAGLFLTTLLLGGLSVYVILSLQSNAKLINYVGIVRGESQRLVKLELNDQHNDAMIQKLDDILLELSGGGGSVGLPKPNDQAYLENLRDLNQMWGQLKQTIIEYRDDHLHKNALMKLSETYFNKANDTVFSAESFTSSKLHTLMMIWGGMLVLILMVWLFILWAGSKKLLGLETANRKLHDITKRDTLTGVYQYTYFKEKAQQRLDEAGSKHYAVVYTDFADFKYINDVYGYSYGDSILSHYGKILMDGLQEDELCGRVSADNFVLLLRYENRDELAKRQKKSDRKIHDYMQNAHDHQILSSCCGICCIDDVEEHLLINGYVDRANLARSTVKNGNKPNYMYYNEEIRNHMIEEKNIESRMHDAFKNNEFFVEYQPKVDLKTGKIASAEALVRWKLNDETVIPPDHFIPVFERNFLINQLDQYVMREVCRWLRELLDQGKPVLPVAVNISRLQFYDHYFVERYVQIREEYHIPPELIEIEFTESIAFDNNSLLEMIINDLKKHQFKCSIDDFGKGYSSLSLLKNLPIDYLKIDRYFFVEGEDATRDLALVEGIIDMVHKLHMKTIAEGIESSEQVEMLKKIGCDYIQGFIFYHPMSAKEYELLLQQNSK